MKLTLPIEVMNESAIIGIVNIIINHLRFFISVYFSSGLPLSL